MPIFYDLNGDRRPDQVQLFATNNRGLVHIEFAKGGSKQLFFEPRADGQGLLYADDIDNDNTLDLIWIVRNQPDSAVIWLGDGRGDFKPVSDISPYKAGLSHLYIDPFAPGIFSDLAGKNPGCVSGTWNDFQVLSENVSIPVPAGSSQPTQSAIPAKELDSSLTQLQVRPPPFLS